LNDVARRFLETYAQGGEVEGGWKFGKALQQARLDHSPDSLDRLDLLLKAIRERAKPRHDEFIADAQGRNFLALLAFYLMAVLSRRTGAEIEWHDTASAQRATADWASISETPFTRLVALAPDQGLLFLPLVWLHDRLFLLGLGQRETAADYLDSVAGELEYDLPMAWWNAARVLGLAAAHQLAALADGQPAPPRITWEHPLAQRSSARTLSYDGEDAVAHGEAALEHNAEGNAWKTFAYDTWITSSGARTRAVSAAVQTYDASPLRLRMAFRYQPAADGRGFAVLDPLAWEFSVPEEQFLRLHAAVWRSLRNHPWPAGLTWERVFEGRRGVPSLMPAAIHLPPAYATGEPVRVGDAALVDGGVTPARVVQLVPGSDGRTACVFLDVRGARRSATSTQVEQRFLFVERSPADHGAACIAWLEARIRQPARQRLDPDALAAPAHACFALGSLTWEGLAVARNPVAAKQLWQAAADAGNAAAELALAVIHLEGDTVPVDTARGMTLLRGAAARGHVPALARLGQELETGLRVPGDVAQAVSLLTRASAAGDAHATYRLAWMHRIGKGVRHDIARCVALIAQAAAGEHAQAQYELAMHCSTGDGVLQDDERAVYWLQRAVAGGHGEAMILLAGKYERGRGVPQDLARAVALYRQAADRKIPAAWYHLGVMAADGRGLQRDLHEARRLMTLAAQDGVGDAQSQLEDLELAMAREGPRA
jgi:TPR repeat protein